MNKWHLPLWIVVLCMTTACGTETVSSETTPSSEPTPLAESQEAPETPTSASQSTPATADPQSASKSAVQDTTIVPGERVGPVTRTTTRDDLVAMFGEAALEDTEIPVGEGFTEPATVVNSDSDQAFAIVWLDDSQTQPATVTDFGPAWETVEGFGLGTPYSELESTLGEFELYGLAWDYEGTLVLEGSELDHYSGLMVLRVRPTEEAVKAAPEAYQAVSGDQLLKSDNPNLDPLNLSIYDMVVYLTPLEQ